MLAFNLMDNIHNTYKKNRILFSVCIFFVLLSLPKFGEMIGNGLDISWFAFLNYSLYKGAVWGENTFFTYGPLGFLDVPLNVGYNLLISNTVWIIVWIINIFVIFNIASRKRITNTLDIVIICISSLLYCLPPAPDMLGVGGSEYLCFVSFLLIIAIWQGEIQYVIPFNILVTLSFYIKFSSFFTILGALIGYSLLFIIFHNKKSLISNLLLLWIWVPLSFVSFMLYCPSIPSFFRYIKGCLEISMGYNSAMSYPANDAAVFWAIIVAIIFLIMFFIFFKRKIEVICIFSSSFAMFFFYYKHGFVRHGGIFFFSGLSMIFAAILFSINISDILVRIQNKKEKFFVIIGGILIFLICFFNVYSSSIFTKIQSKTFNYPIKVINVISDHGEGASKLPDSFKRIIGDKSVNIYPWELSYGLDKDINISWAPIIQNYSSYTKWCDIKNADYYESENKAPNFIVFSFATIDRRYPLIETPRTWHAIKNNYEFVLQDGNLSLLMRKKIQNDDLKKILIKSEKINQNQLMHSLKADSFDISIPKNARFLSINSKLSLKGKIFKLIWKIPEIYMNIKCSDNTKLSGRVLLDLLDTEIISIDEIGRYGDYEKTVKDLPQYEMEKINFTGPGVKYYKNITINWFSSRDKEASYPEYIGDEDIKFSSYNHKKTIDINRVLTVIKFGNFAQIKEKDSWAYAKWENSQNICVSSDGKLYALKRNMRLDVTNYFNLHPNILAGISGFFPIGKDNKLIIYDDTKKEYCSISLNEYFPKQ